MTKHDAEDQDGSSPAAEAATPDETRAALLVRSGRAAAPIRKTFVQRPQDEADRRGVLYTFVANRDLRGLKAYLLLVAINSSGEGPGGWSTTLPLTVWARAFDTTKDAGPGSATAAVSKTLTRLEQRKLISRDRTGRERKVRVTILREDGSGDPYTRPVGEGGPENRYLSLPYAYWTGGWHAKLSLPATAMLLVALHEPPVFDLATERMQKWYGWSPDTAERGFNELVEEGLLQKTARRKKAPLSPTGMTTFNEYQLIGPFKRTKPKKNAPRRSGAKRAAVHPAQKPVAAAKTSKTSTGRRAAGSATRKK